METSEDHHEQTGKQTARDGWRWMSGQMDRLMGRQRGERNGARRDRVGRRFVEV